MPRNREICGVYKGKKDEQRLVAKPVGFERVASKFGIEQSDGKEFRLHSGI
jgi:hypothetical protein